MSLWRASPNSPKWSPAIAVLVLAIPLLVVVLATGLDFVPQTDEAKFHWDTAQQFGETLPAIPWRDYHAATTPLPYLLWGAWGRLFGFGLPALRALTLLMSYAGVLAFYALSRHRGHQWPLVESLLLLFSPYLFLNSFTIYTMNMGLLFEVLALRFYLDMDEDGLSRMGLLWGSLAATAAIYCRQHYIFLPAGMGMWWAISRWRERRIDWGDLWNLALIALPILLMLPLFLAWGGVTPPAFQGLHPLVLRPEHINFLVIFVGLYFAPVAIVAWPALVRWGRRAAWLALAGPLYVFFQPYYERSAGTLSSSEQGIILHGLDVVRELVGPLAPTLGGFVLWANGLVIGATGFCMTWKDRNGEAVKLWSWVAAFAGILLVSDFVGERFYALLMPVLLLLFYPRLSGRRTVVGFWLATMMLIALVYSVVKMRGG